MLTNLSHRFLSQVSKTQLLLSTITWPYSLQSSDLTRSCLGPTSSPMDLWPSSLYVQGLLPKPTKDRLSAQLLFLLIVGPWDETYDLPMQLHPQSFILRQSW